MMRASGAVALRALKERKLVVKLQKSGLTKQALLNNL